MSFIQLHGFIHMESKCHWKNGIGIRLQPKYSFLTIMNLEELL